MLFLVRFKKIRPPFILFLMSLLIPTFSFAMMGKHKSFDYEERRRIQKVGQYNAKKHDFSDFSFNAKPSPTAIFVLLLVGICCEIAAAQKTPSPSGAYFMDESCNLTADSQVRLASSGLVCNEQALKRGALFNTRFTSFESSFPHTGIYVGHHGIRTSSEAQKVLETELMRAVSRGEISESSSKENDISLVIPRLKHAYKTYELEPSRYYIDPLDSTAYRDTLDWVEKEILNKELFTNLKNDQLIEYLKKTNCLSRNLNTSDFRNIYVVIKKTLPFVPGFSEIQEMGQYLENQDPECLPLYHRIIELLESMGKSAAIRENWFLVIKRILHHKKPDIFFEFVDRYYAYNNLSQKKIQEQLKKTFNRVKYIFNTDPLKAAATLHQDIVDIHPFTEGNGRTARIWTNILLKQAGYPGIVFHRNDIYNKAVNEALRANNSEIFEDYIRKQICKVTELYDDPSFDHGSPLEELVNNCEINCQEQFNKLIRRFGL